MKKLIMVALAGGIMLSARADSDYLTETVDGISWAYKVVDDVAVIVSRSTYGKIKIPTSLYPYYDYEWGWCHYPSISSNTVGVVSIPSYLGGKPVTSIDSYSFYNCDKISALTIPSCITNISAFSCISYCKGLTSIHIDDLEALYSRIHLASALLHKGVDLYVGGQVVTEAVIPEGVTTINAYAFCNWDKLTKVVLPSTLETIGAYAFSGCSGLTKVVLPSTLETIGAHAFSGCSGLSKVIFPEGMTSIGYQAFYGCSGLAEIYIPSSMKFIGYDAFRRCFRLRDVALPKMCFGHVSMNGRFDDGNYALDTFFEVDRIRNLTIESEIGSIGHELRAFTNLTSITIPQSVTNIAADAFENCPRLRAEWFKTLSAVSAKGVGAEARYDLADYAADRTIASVTVDGDAAIDEFVLTDGKVYDCVLRIVNAASKTVRITLPKGYAYESFAGASPLTLPANSTNMLTITRTGAATFLVSRRRLQSIGQ